MNSAPAEPELGGFDDLPDEGLGAQSEPNDKPFDDTPFDAGVEANEEDDPKTFIQQLSGKLGQSLRKYSSNQDQPDFDLEKFAVNSVLSATHTSDMDDQDQKDIINKVKSSGQGDDDVNVDVNVDTGNEDENSQEEPVDNQPEEDNFDENLNNTENSRIFEQKVNDIIMSKLKESKMFGGPEVETVIDEVLGDHTNSDPKPMTKPDEGETITKPETDRPLKKPSRRERIWSPKPGTSPDPKAEL